MTLNKNEIQARLARATKVIDVPLWGASVTLYALSVKEDRHVKAEAAKIGVTEVTTQQLKEAADAYQADYGEEALKEALKGVDLDNTGVAERPRLMRMLGRLPIRTPEQADQAERVNLLLLSYSLRGDDGKPMFTIEELEDMATINPDGQRSDNVLELLIAEAYDLNGYTQQAGHQEAGVEDAAKKS